MFNIEKSLKNSNFYFQNFPIFSEFIFQLVGVFVILEFLRQELPEIKLLQLIPGYYFFLLFILIVSFFLFNTFFSLWPSFLDSKKFLGTKTILKSQYSILGKFFYFFAFVIFFTTLNSLIPGQFDSFYNYTEKSFENLWSFEDFLNLQSLLVFVLLIISQSPILTFYLINNNIKIFKLSNSLKFFLFFILLISGVLTPTADVISQLIFSFFAVFFYLISLHFLSKRIYIKYLSLSNLD